MAVKRHYRVRPWIDLDSDTPLFGIQARVDGRWLNVATGGLPLFFDTQESAQSWIRRQRAS